MPRNYTRKADPDPERDEPAARTQWQRRGMYAQQFRAYPEGTLHVWPYPGAWVDAKGRLHGRAKVV